MKYDRLSNETALQYIERVFGKQYVSKNNCCTSFFSEAKYHNQPSIEEQREHLLNQGVLSFK